jgi:hypothetical protein
MLRKFVCAAVITVVGLSFAMADEFQAIISKVDGNKVTFKKAKKGEVGDDMTLPVTADAKITKGKFNADTKKLEAGDAVADGLKNEMFTKTTDKGVRATITTDADNKNITAITVGGGGKGKKKKDA